MLTDTTKFHIVAGEALVAALVAETERLCQRTGAGYNSDQLCSIQRGRSAAGIVGAEIVKSNYGHSVRYDSGLQNFSLLASSRAKQIDGTLEGAERWAAAWVAADPARRYAWRRV